MKKHLLLAVSLALASFGAAAQDVPSYTYVEAGYAQTDIDGLGDGDGIGLNGSFGLGENWHIFGNYTAETNDEFGLDIDMDTYRVGGGYHYAFGAATNLEVNAFYENINFSVDDGIDSGEVEVDGFGVEVGVRGKFVPKFEGWAYLGYVEANNGSVDINGEEEDVDLDGDGGSTFGRVGAQYSFTPTWGVVGNAWFDGDVTRTFIGVRASF